MSINTNLPPRFHRSSPCTSSVTIPQSHITSPHPFSPRRYRNSNNLDSVGAPPLYQQKPKEVTVTCQFWGITTTTTNTMLIIIIIIRSKMQIMLDIHKKDKFLLPARTEAVFNTTSSPGFYSSAIHFSQIILVFWRLLSVMSY